MHADTQLTPTDGGGDTATQLLATVLLATDGSPDAAAARRVAVDLATRAGARLHVVTAWLLPATTYLAPAVPAQAFDYSEAAARAVLDEQRRDLPAQLTVTAEAVRGPAGDVVVEAADRVRADIIVLGSRGLGAVARVLVGSVADAVVRRGGCPVLVVRGAAAAWPCQHIVVGVDGSADSLRAVDAAALIARTLDVPVDLVGTVSFPGGGSGPGLELLRHGELDAMRQSLNALATELASSGLRARAIVSQGDAAPTLLAMAGETDPATLIVVGRRGVGGLHRALLGSVSNAILHAASGPVLVVPHRRADRAETAAD